MQIFSKSPEKNKENDYKRHKTREIENMKED
jgi:hypothetical protein